jgi:hypothetical protein
VTFGKEKQNQNPPGNRRVLFILAEKDIGRKRYWPKKILAEKDIGRKRYWPKKILAEKDIGLRRLGEWVPRTINLRGFYPFQPSTLAAGPFCGRDTAGSGF